jgi:hypothetical protein
MMGTIVVNVMGNERIGWMKKGRDELVVADHVGLMVLDSPAARTAL